MNRLTPTELEQILYDAAECSCQHCQRVRRMWEHVKAVERENAQLKQMLTPKEKKQFQAVSVGKMLEDMGVEFK